ncbi:hypothetical protein ACQ86N_32145 [Puia sp. P3]|uniref:hypothetical protein n=1 Tax=Puia sp. P3 TaxID=3423952 RepID=UPI003D669E0B
MSEKLKTLAREFAGELYDDDTTRTLYATDASAYREMPQAVAVPRTTDDLKKLIQFARSEKPPSSPAPQAPPSQDRW